MNTYVAKTFAGLEEVLAEELRHLNATDVQILKRAVQFKGDKEILYKANLHCRTALSILSPIINATVKNENDLYNSVKKFDWSPYFPDKQTLAINSVVHSDFFNHTKYVALKTKDAIVDQLREKRGTRPSVDVQNPDIKINVHINRSQLIVSLDSSGQTLNKRGYRKETGNAPINEVLAAGLIKLSGWDTKTNFIDPMCGSGTFLIEAALIHTNTAPGILRDFAFEQWPDFDLTLWKKLRKEAQENQIEATIQFSGYDKDNDVLQAATKNVFGAGLVGRIRLNQADIKRIKLDSEPGFVVMNPPYGERLKLDNASRFYQMLGDSLKQNFTGKESWILSSDLQNAKLIGLKPSRKIPIYNGALECRFFKFEVYEGSKRVRPPKNLKIKYKIISNPSPDQDTEQEA